jgi:ABC-type antimicrobial peptide transport system permease subunit
LGIEESQAVGQEFEVSFVVTGNLLADSQSKVESVPARYQIVGVVPENNTPFFYVLFIDLRSLGIDNFTQAKLVSKSQAELGQIRQKIESLGFNTESVVDTVDQIERLFGTIRIALITVGMIALGVAALGMFNTLTVSLLERTHEVGLMKTMGMKSNEVEDLFLTESVAMGLFGGLAGVVLGFMAGKMTSLVLTLVALRSGAGVIDVSDIPPSLIALVLGMSLTVGLLTGIYPAWRAKKSQHLMHYVTRSVKVPIFKALHERHGRQDKQRRQKHHQEVHSPLSTVQDSGA